MQSIIIITLNTSWLTHKQCCNSILFCFERFKPLISMACDFYLLSLHCAFQYVTLSEEKSGLCLLQTGNKSVSNCKYSFFFLFYNCCNMSGPWRQVQRHSNKVRQKMSEGFEASCSCCKDLADASERGWWQGVTSFPLSPALFDEWPCERLAVS